MGEEWKLGYLAGLIDGEGSICFRSDNRGTERMSLVLSIASNTLLCLTMIQKEFGGHLYLKSSKELKKAQGYTLAWHGKKAQRLLEDVLIYLIIKRPQAELAIEFPIKDRAYYGANLTDEEKAIRGCIYLAVKELNQRNRTRKNDVD
jgi:hypothetical protein